MKIEIYDTTLRDGAQGAGINYTDADRAKIMNALDRLGVSYIEAVDFAALAGISGADERLAAAKEAAAGLHFSKAAGFLSTRRPGETVADNTALITAAAFPVEYVTIYGKSWLRQVTEVLGTTAEENLAMIRDTIVFLRDAGKHVFFDAEHFFDGYSDNPAYAMAVLGAALDAGAETLILCDTNGGMMPDVIGMTTETVCRAFPGARIGIHCHNDLGMAVSCSLSAVLGGACQVQGTVSGIGERCGNANLNTLIPLLQLKMGFSCIDKDQLVKLTETARYVNEIANITFNEHEPFVGGHAFTHKAGTHIDAVTKSPRAMEHMDPSLVGNERNLLVSSLSGRAALLDKMTAILPGLEKNSSEVASAVALVREYEAEGFSYEDAEASLYLLIREALGLRRDFFALRTFKVFVEETEKSEAGDGTGLCSALVKVAVDGCEEITAAEGDGPVNALDLALRRALVRFYPTLEKMCLCDYKVRVINSSDATASKVRVLIESTDGIRIWRTVGVSVDIIHASWQALRDSVEYMLLSNKNEN